MSGRGITGAGAGRLLSRLDGGGPIVMQGIRKGRGDYD